tara:strand:- start:7846 stop:8391 length:546 start_codon:yes stop_codon:yes gene_type:complete
MDAINSYFKTKVIKDIKEEIQFIKENNEENEEYIEGLEYVLNALLNPEQNKDFIEKYIQENSQDYKYLDELKDCLKYGHTTIEEHQKIPVFCIELNRNNIVFSETIKKVFPEEYLSFKVAYKSRDDAFKDYQIIIDKLLDYKDHFSLLIEEKKYSLSDLKDNLPKEDFQVLMNNNKKEGTE